MDCPSGLADPYVKAQLGPYRLRTNIQKKTLTPKWHEEFKIPICSWESTNVLAIDVCDKDLFGDENLGVCSVNIGDLRDGQRHDMWLPLKNIKTGRLHIAITVVEANRKEGVVDRSERKISSEGNKAKTKGSPSSELSRNTKKIADSLEAMNVVGPKWGRNTG
ncbi:hypothetical protein Nepgr_027462 [Nepenthes gracilis]|uniref:C2 domain-containing protein n=1 Tax=Nepenthes gracilis TaxID=150966 RepID=A0AAD3Y348_NEPGR|nr:hypothetical protein Nepgr_027462 [Nepenthes gracilis]